MAANYDGSSADTEQIMTSTDAITWTRVTEPTNARFFRSATDDSGRFVVVPQTTSYSPNKLLVSTGGLSWTEVTTPFASNEDHGNVSYGNGSFLIFNQTTMNESITSPDGTTWTTHTVPSGIWMDAAYGNGRWVAVARAGGTNTLMYSDNGIDGWTPATDPVTSGGSTQKNWISVAYGGGLYVALNYQYNPPIMKSTDGINWSTVSEPTATFWTEITYANGKFVAVSEDGKTMVSACD